MTLIYKDKSVLVVGWSQQIVKYLRNEWIVPKDFEQAVRNQQNSMPYDFIDTPSKLEVDKSKHQ